MLVGRRGLRCEWLWFGGRLDGEEVGCRWRLRKRVGVWCRVLMVFYSASVYILYLTCLGLDGVMGYFYLLTVELSMEST